MDNLWITFFIGLNEEVLPPNAINNAFIGLNKEYAKILKKYLLFVKRHCIFIKMLTRRSERSVPKACTSQRDTPDGKEGIGYYIMYCKKRLPRPPESQRKTIKNNSYGKFSNI